VEEVASGRRACRGFAGAERTKIFPREFPQQTFLEVFWTLIWKARTSTSFSFRFILVIHLSLARDTTALHKSTKAVETEHAEDLDLEILSTTIT
jgi:hypothetical protein